MKWLAVVGSREVDSKIRRDIEKYVGQKIADGLGIVSGGATGADYEAARIAYTAGLTSEHFRIYLPTRLTTYCRALDERAQQGKCDTDDARKTNKLLKEIMVNRPGVIYENTYFDSVDATSFHARNEQIVALADELVAFRVDHSRGTTFTIDCAVQKGIQAKVFDY